MAIDILLIEELLASEMLWQQSPSSLRAEATAMVASLIQDFARISGLRSAVLLSPTAAASFCQQQLLPPQVLSVITADGVAAWLQHPNLAPETIRRLLILAPEFSNLLVERLAAAESAIWRQTQLINLPSAAAAVFSDKYATARWLRQHALATPKTWLLTASQRDTFVQASGPADAGAASDGQSWFVIKPRDGAGCNQINLLQLPRDSVRQLDVVQHSELSGAASSEAAWILQRRVRGLSCSVSLIGQGTAGTAIILPPGRQRISRTREGRLQYRGGQIPCEPGAAALITRTAERFAAALGPFNGWLGIDVVVADSAGYRGKGEDVWIIEVNPRLCTSYIGYRELAGENLALRLLRLSDTESPIHWLTGKVHFNVSGGKAEVGLRDT